MRLQDEFVATVSRELRTPLTSILGFASNLLTFWDRMGDEQRCASVGKIMRAGHTGTGLGLYICKQHVEAMGGTFWYRPGSIWSTAKGSTFSVTLPPMAPLGTEADPDLFPLSTRAT